MARAGQRVPSDHGRLEDRISVALLARAFPRQAVDEVIAAAGVRERRTRMLPAWLTTYFVLALPLFMDAGAGRVMRRLADTLGWAGRDLAVVIPSEEALSNARARLGAEPLRLLFERAAGFTAEPGTPGTPGTPGAFWRGLRLVSLDATTLNLQDTVPNRARFGARPRLEDAGGGPADQTFPQARLAVLTECGTEALAGAVIGSRRSSERALARRLLPRLSAGMLAAAALGPVDARLWREAAATGAELLWRADGEVSLPVDRTLADGTYLSWLLPAGGRLSAGGNAPVRVLRYRSGPGRPVTLITTLLDSRAAPAPDLARLYHSRCEIEAVLAVLRHDQQGSLVLRSKTPDGTEQEIWALLCVCHAVRELRYAMAGLVGPDPVRISIVVQR